MLAKFWEGVADSVGERWVALVLSPALLYWAAVLLAYLQQAHAKVSTVKTYINGRTSAELVALAVAAALVVVATMLLVHRLRLTVLRVLEGYWPRVARPLRTLLVWVWSKRIERKGARYEALLAQMPLSAAQQSEAARLDVWLRRFPVDPDRRMPTRLGNILRAAEDRPRQRYGLDPIIVWPRLWLVLSEERRTPLQESRAALDGTIDVWLLGVAFLPWVVWEWWAVPLSLLVACAAYLWARNPAEAYGDLLEAAFDVARVDLYRSLRWPLPASAAEELAAGARATAYLWRGEVPGGVVWRGD
ncbi:MAG: hypothetical protein JSS99_11215 [Actinobacteria bacterium]|nr:hypothetical protein [Actinomycetota bacterium]